MLALFPNPVARKRAPRPDEVEVLANMKRKRAFYTEAFQGLLSFIVLWYILFGDPTRYPSMRWIKAVRGGFPASSPCFLGCLLLLAAMEGVKAARGSGKKAGPRPLRQALAYYLDYWKAAVPLTALGFAFFNVKKLARIYCPMFEKPSLPDLVRAVAALTNELHEGAWLIFCLAVCGVFAWLYDRVRRRGFKAALLLPLVGIALVAALYRFVIPFRYHSAIYPIAAVACVAGYFLAFLARRRLGARRRPAWAGKLARNRVVRFLTAPMRYVGLNWVAFWTASFFFAFYFYNIPASVHAATGSALLSYLAILLITGFVVFALDWGCREFARAWRASKWSVISVAAMLAVPLLLSVALEASADYGTLNYMKAEQWPYYSLLSCMGILCVIMALRAVTGRWHAAGIVATVLIVILGIANHFTIKYHGTLLTFEDLQNVQTAANVVGGYDFSIDKVARTVLLYGSGALACCLLAWFAFRKARPAFVRGGRWVTRGVCLAAAAGIFFFIYLGRVPLIESEVLVTWDRVYSQVGYFNGTVVNISTYNSLVVRKPAGFSEMRVEELSENARASAAEAPAQAAGQAESYPDIIMILNETWYNVDDFMVTNADVDYMRNYNAMDNAVKGHVVVPLVGGGTNSTEYESLTANSTSLINAYSPFNRLDMSNKVTLPTYLKQFDYASFAAHPMYGKNYNRSHRWKQMGFDQTWFIDDFTDLKFYGNRKGAFNRCTDTSAFENMVRFYEELPEDRPRLGYFITIQNHGGWDSNKPDQALVHSSVAGADKATTNSINELLSCMLLTDESIAYLQQYYTDLYRNTGRRVVVCMFGDHCPSMIETMTSMSRHTDPSTREMWQKSTPYFIWANYPLDMASLNLEGTDTMDLCCLMPTVLDVAGIPLSYYYRHMVDMRKDVSVFTNVGSGYTSTSSDMVYCDRDGQAHDIGEGSDAATAVSDYYCMEYKNLTARKADPASVLFQPAGIVPSE